MTINYVLTVKANIVLDGDFTYSGMANKYHSLTEYIDKARFYISEYGFVSAIVVDTETGEILVEMESDCNDFFNDDGPEYYDDGDTCGYE